jgi:hypothetical protein
MLMAVVDSTFTRGPAARGRIPSARAAVTVHAADIILRLSIAMATGVFLICSFDFRIRRPPLRKPCQQAGASDSLQ